MNINVNITRGGMGSLGATPEDWARLCRRAVRGEVRWANQCANAQQAFRAAGRPIPSDIASASAPAAAVAPNAQGPAPATPSQAATPTPAITTTTPTVTTPAASNTTPATTVANTPSVVTTPAVAAAVVNEPAAVATIAPQAAAAQPATVQRTPGPDTGGDTPEARADNWARSCQRAIGGEIPFRNQCANARAAYALAQRPIPDWMNATGPAPRPGPLAPTGPDPFAEDRTAQGNEDFGYGYSVPGPTSLAPTGTQTTTTTTTPTDSAAKSKAGLILGIGAAAVGGLALFMFAGGRKR